MATFKVVVRKKRADGFYPVYIRVVHRSRMGYIKTDKLITDKQITKNGEIKDIVVNEYCSREILRYSDMINRKDVSNYSVAELIEFLIHSDEEICFSDYATKFINRMASEGHERNAKNYRLAVNHLERYLGTTRVMFTHLSSSVLTRWINSLSLTNRAKEMYPTCLRQIFKRALIELNDEERGIVRIKYNPWLKVSIPKSDSTVQRAISAEACREFFNRPLPETKMISSLPELGRDVALLSLCLGGINTVDIFELKKENYKDGIIGYKRAKTNWESATVTTLDDKIIPYITDICKRDPRTGKVVTGGIVSCQDSSWLLSWTINRQGQFKDQDKDKVCVWVYGLFTDVPGDYIKKPMKECTGKEITEEWLYHLGVPVDQIEDMAENSAVCVPTMMPYITAFFMPRTKGDRPDVIPDGCVNFAFLGQFADTPRGTVFTTEYSVRTAMEAVYGLLGVDRGVPEVWGSVYDIRELLDSSVKLMDGKSPLEIELPGPLDMLKKPLLKAVKGTVIEKVLRDHDVIKDYMM